MNQIYFVGYDGIHKSDFKYIIPEGFDCYLLILTHTSALFRINGVIQEYPAHTAILYPPNHEIWYAANGKTYKNSWIRFASDETFVTNFPRQSIPFPVSDSEYCHHLIQLLTWETSQLTSTSRHYQNTGIITHKRDAHLKHADTDSNQSYLIISKLLNILFTKLYDDIFYSSNNSYDQELLMLRKRIANVPQFPWNISDMANQLHISTGYLQLLYKQKFNIACMEDVIQHRLKKQKIFSSILT